MAASSTDHQSSPLDDMSEPRGKRPQIEKLMTVYWDVHKDRLLPLYQKDSGSKDIKDWSSFMVNAWAEEPPEVRHAVEGEREKRYDTALEKWSKSGSHPLDIETQRRFASSHSVHLPPSLTLFNAQ